MVKLLVLDKCFSEFRLSGHNFLSCLDECKHCDANAICVNGHCICPQGFVGDGLECWGKFSYKTLLSCFGESRRASRMLE